MRGGILQTINDELQKHCPPEYQMMADLPNTNYGFPSAAASTDLRPDLVMWSDSQQVMVLAELTVCFETNLWKHLKGRRASTRTCWRLAWPVVTPLIWSPWRWEAEGLSTSLASKGSLDFSPCRRKTSLPSSGGYLEKPLYNHTTFGRHVIKLTDYI